jgi:very-short-patch-repair endonuclease
VTGWGRRASQRELEKSYVHNIPAARRLRQTQTRSEELLWDALRGGRLDGVKFRRQHAVGPYILDFYCDDCRLAVEVDGGIHLDWEQQERDRERQAILEEREIAFLRVPASRVEQDLPAVLGLILSALQARGRYGRATGSPPLPQRWGKGSRGEG